MKSRFGLAVFVGQQLPPKVSSLPPTSSSSINKSSSAPPPGAGVVVVELSTPGVVVGGSVGFRVVGVVVDVELSTLDAMQRVKLRVLGDTSINMRTSRKKMLLLAIESTSLEEEGTILLLSSKQEDEEVRLVHPRRLVVAPSSSLRRQQIIIVIVLTRHKQEGYWQQTEQLFSRRLKQYSTRDRNDEAWLRTSCQKNAGDFQTTRKKENDDRCCKKPRLSTMLLPRVLL